MFKSKGFTIAFIFLSILILGLSGVFLYLVLGQGISSSQNTQATVESRMETYSVDYSITEEPTVPIVESTEPEDFTGTTETASEEDPTEETTSALATTEETTTEETTTEEASKEAENPESLYPGMGKVYACSGKLTVLNTTGLIFHKKAALDGKNAEGNQIVYSGTFDVTGKIFILDENQEPYLMYQTSDGYFVTGDPTFVSYEAGSTVYPADEKRVTTYGLSESDRIAVRVLYEDGNQVVFSLYSFYEEEFTPILLNLVASYEATGVARFDYADGEGALHSGSIAFEKSKVEGYDRLVDIWFEEAVLCGNLKRDNIVLHD